MHTAPLTRQLRAMCPSALAFTTGVYRAWLEPPRAQLQQTGARVAPGGCLALASAEPEAEPPPAPLVVKTVRLLYSLLSH